MHVLRHDRSGLILFEKSKRMADLAAASGHSSAYFTDNKFLRVNGVMTRCGVFRYVSPDGEEWGELREEADVFAPASMRSFGLLAGTNDHPQDFVTADNVREFVIGWNGAAYRDNLLMRSELAIFDEEAIQNIRDGKRELSNGYWSVPVRKIGTHPTDGSYKYKQTELIGNHWSLVDIARGGPVCRVEFDSQKQPAIDFSIGKIRITAEVHAA